MIFDFAQTSARKWDKPEVIIVGSGAVGLTLAVTLARRGKKVLVLEAGGRGLDGHSQEFFKSATSTGHELAGLYQGRFRQLGGTTNFWGGQLVPFDEVIFERRPWVAEVAWPIRPAELARYYDQTMQLIGMERQIASSEEIWRQLAVEPPPPPEELELFFTRWAPQKNFAVLFKNEIAHHPNLVVLINAPVVALIPSAGDGEIAGALVRDESGREEQFTAATTVLANGTIEIARLLQCPLANNTMPVWAKNYWLGKGFLDHIDCYAGSVRLLDAKRFHNLFDNAVLNRIKYQPKIKLSEETQRREQLFGIAAHFVFNSSMQENIENAKILIKALMTGTFSKKATDIPASLVGLAKVVMPMMSRYIRYRRIYSFADRGIQLRLSSEHRSLPTSNVHLKEQKDSLGMPIVGVNWEISGDEVTTMFRFTEAVKKYLKSNGLADIEIDPALARQDPAFLDSLDDANHHMGTVRTGNSAAEGVVDFNLKVFGSDNLYVAGAAVYPTSGFPNPTFLAMALGQRLAEHLLAGS